MSDSERAHNGQTKIDRYKWSVIDEMGEFKLIQKESLNVDQAYQRARNDKKAQTIASAFNWRQFGVLMVSRREDGSMWVYDGQHRLDAALKRSDVTHVPCLIFRHVSVKNEARSFVDGNSNRIMVGAQDKFRALGVAEDEVALYVQDLAMRHGITFVRSSVTTPLSTRSVAWFLKRASDPRNRNALESVTAVVAQLCATQAVPILEVLLEGIWTIAQSDISLVDPKMRHRMGIVGARGLVQAAQTAAAYYAKGGGRVYAEGMLNAINKGQRKTFKLRDSEAESGEPS
jgi:hypothetical protein